MKTTGERIKDIRLELGETLEEFGKRFNTSKATVFYWEKGRNLPNKSNLKKIAELGGLSVEDLIYRKPIGQKIKSIRRSLGYSQLEFSKAIGATKSAVNNWENGYNYPNNERLKVIAELGGMTVKELHFSSLIGQRIKHIRVSRKETLEQFAENIIKASNNSAKTGKSNVSRWEKGLNKPNDITLEAIAKLGNTTVNQLLNSNPLSDYSTDELLQELERRGD